MSAVTWQEILMAPIPAPDIPYPREFHTPKCEVCGRFTKKLTLVYVGYPPEPDYAVGDCCSDK